MNAAARSPRHLAAARSRSQKIQKAAQDFEAMAIAQLLAPMFETVDQSKGMFGGGEGEAAWKPMMISSLAKQMAAHGGLGLAQSRHAADAADAGGNNDTR